MPRARGLVLDLLALAGVGAVLVGLYRAWPPGAFIFGGALLALPAALDRLRGDA